MSTSPPERETPTPSRRVLVGMVLIVLIGAAANGLLESGLGGEPLVDYDNDIVDIAAVDELARRGIDPCPEVGEPMIPDDLAAGLEGTECVPYDTSAGLGPAIVGVAILGAVIVITSGNRFGLYLIWLALILVVGGASGAYADRGARIRPGSLPGADLVGLIAGPFWIVVGVLIAPRLILMFPTGELSSTRWRWVTRASWIPALLLIVSQWLDPLGLADTRNPLPFELAQELSLGIFNVGLLLWLSIVMVSFAGLLWRFITARGEERQQLKWVAYAVALALVVNVAATFLGPLSGTVQQVANFVILPIAVLFSIFKSRLYDIDRIINRTVVYGLVTVVLGGLFAAVVVVPQTLLIGGPGLEPGFIVVVALATLFVAAIFNPLRNRIRRAVDRRFNRRHFDARDVVEHLQERLKEPGEADTLVEDVSSVVEAAMEPSQIAVWRPGGRS